MNPGFFFRKEGVTKEFFQGVIKSMQVFFFPIHLYKLEKHLRKNASHHLFDALE